MATKRREDASPVCRSASGSSPGTAAPAATPENGKRPARTGQSDAYQVQLAPRLAIASPPPQGVPTRSTGLRRLGAAPHIRRSRQEPQSCGQRLDRLSPARPDPYRRLLPVPGPPPRGRRFPAPWWLWRGTRFVAHCCRGGPRQPRARPRPVPGQAGLLRCRDRPRGRESPSRRPAGTPSHAPGALRQVQGREIPVRGPPRGWPEGT